MGVYWASHEQRDKYLEYRDVVFMDCTAKKSNLLWPVCLAVGVNEENKSVILGQAILMSEDERSFEFFLDRLSTYNGVKMPASVVFTDECSAEINAVKKVFPKAHNFRCDWHFLKDIVKKLSSTGLGDDAKERVLDLFQAAWYSKTEARFKTRMEIFMDHLKTLPATTASSLTKYFQGQLGSQTRWAHCYRSSVLTLLANSTQRVEGVNAQIKRTCSGSTTFAHLIIALENIRADAEDATVGVNYDNINSVLLRSILIDLNNKKGVGMIVEVLKSHLSHFAVNKVLFELRHAHMFTVDVDSTLRKFKVVPYCVNVV